MALSPSDNLITHKKVSSEVSPVNCGDWNANHDIKNLMGYILIEERVLPAGTTSTTFSGLDGDIDEEYLIEGNIDLIPVSAASFVYLRPNGISSGYKGSRYGSYSGTTAVGTADITAGLLLTFSPVVEACYCCINSVLKCNPGRYKLLHSRDTVYGATRTGGSISNSALPSSENFDNLVIVCSTGSFSGTIRLWKKIPVEV